MLSEMERYEHERIEAQILLEQRREERAIHKICAVVAAYVTKNNEGATMNPAVKYVLDTILKSEYTLGTQVGADLAVFLQTFAEQSPANRELTTLVYNDENKPVAIVNFAVSANQGTKHYVSFSEEV
jgi:hypothetical protein